MLHDARLLLHLSPLCIRLCGLFILTLLSKLYSAFCLRSLAHRVRRHLHPNQESEGIPFFIARSVFFLISVRTVRPIDWTKGCRGKQATSGAVMLAQFRKRRCSHPHKKLVWLCELSGSPRPKPSTLPARNWESIL